jgi:protease-4
MGNFLRNVFKMLATLVVAYAVLGILIFLIFVGLIAVFTPKASVPAKDSVLVVDLGFRLTDRPASEDIDSLLESAFGGELISTLSLNEAVDSIEEAGSDDRIQAILLRGRVIADATSGSFASLAEFRRALSAFGERKPVIAYIDGDGLRDLYVKSAATEVVVNPESLVSFRGLRAERLYMGDAFKRFGIGVQSVNSGTFKTATETYELNAMSDNEREQLVLLLDDLWRVIAGDIAGSRGISVEALNDLAAEDIFLSAEALVEAGVADRIESRDTLIDDLGRRTSWDSFNNTYQQYDFVDYVEGRRLLEPLDLILGSSQQIGVIYIEGPIVDGDTVDGVAGSEAITRYIRDLRDDAGVKGVVVRVNSPGGSASAGMKIFDELERLREEKPVVVSMGGLAASAGYMVSAGADRIFAEPASITGSIGVVTMIMNVEELAAKLSLNFDGVSTHRYADVLSIGRTKTEEEMELLRRMSLKFYNDFIETVAMGREMESAAVRQHAEGHVWSAQAALDRNLIDELGGLNAAVQYAADLAGIGDDFQLRELPRGKTLEESLTEILAEARTPALPLGSGRNSGQLDGMLQQVTEELHRLRSLNDPYGQYAILPYTLRLY